MSSYTAHNVAKFVAQSERCRASIPYAAQDSKAGCGRCAQPKNKADTRGADNNEATEVLRDNEELNFVDHSIINRKAFATAASKGLSVFEMIPTDDKAVTEVEALFSHITGIKK